MKHFYLWMIFPLVISCTVSDNESESTRANWAAIGKITPLPENAANEYDFSGKLHSELCASYESAPTAITSISEAVYVSNALACANPQFQELTSVGYATNSATRLSFVLATPDPIGDVVSQSSLSSKAKISLVNFCSTLDWLGQQGSEYDVIYRFIVDYEESILQDGGFSSQDRQIIFTTTSVARYAHHFASLRKKKPPRDKDWDINVTHIMAATDGSQESVAKAIIMAVAASLYANK